MRVAGFWGGVWGRGRLSAETRPRLRAQSAAAWSALLFFLGGPSWACAALEMGSLAAGRFASREEELGVVIMLGMLLICRRR